MIVTHPITCEGDCLPVHVARGEGLIGLWVFLLDSDLAPLCSDTLFRSTEEAVCQPPVEQTPVRSRRAVLNQTGEVGSQRW